jgi:hypothetical protein
MNNRIEVPKFPSGEEEANWWFENRGMAARTAREAANAILHRALEAETPGHSIGRL